MSFKQFKILISLIFSTIEFKQINYLFYIVIFKCFIQMPIFVIYSFFPKNTKKFIFQQRVHNFLFTIKIQSKIPYTETVNGAGNQNLYN